MAFNFGAPAGGNTNAGGTPTTNLFGAPASTSSGGLFGSTAATTNPPTFGSAAASTAPAFGTLGAGTQKPLSFGTSTPNTSGGGLFGGGSKPATAAGQTSSIFGGGSGGNGGAGGGSTFNFGSAAPSTPGTPAAGSTPATTQGGLFGNKAPTSNMFGATSGGSTTPAPTKTTFGIGNSTTPAGPPPTDTSKASTGGLFGGTGVGGGGGGGNLFGSVGVGAGSSGSNMFSGAKPTPTTTSFGSTPGTTNAAPSTNNNAASKMFPSQAPSSTAGSGTNTSTPSLFGTQAPAATGPNPTSIFGTGVGQPTNNPPSTTTGTASSLFTGMNKTSASATSSSTFPSLGTNPGPGQSNATTTSAGGNGLFSGLGSATTSATTPGTTPSLFPNPPKTSTPSSTAAPAATSNMFGGPAISSTGSTAGNITAPNATASAATSTSQPATTAAASGATPAAINNPAQSFTQPLGASTAGPIPHQPRLKNKTMDEIISRWATDLVKYQKEFQDQATKVAAWDRLLVENGDKIQKLYNSTYEAEKASTEVERQLAGVEGQQAELISWLDRYEADVDQMFEQQIGQGDNLQGPDQERERTYKLAEKLTERLDDMGKNITSMVEAINETSSTLSKSSGKADDPLSKIVRVLNSHLTQLQWIDQNAELLQAKVAAAQKQAQGISSANGAESDAADAFYRSYMGRK